MKTKTNVHINFELSGNKELPVVALSHSLGSSMIMWEPQMKLLSKNFRILRIDTRGHGGSSASPPPYSMDLLVNDAIVLLNSLEIDQVHWVGLSMGGMIGQGLAINAPERLLSLCLCDTMPIVREEMKDVWKHRIKSGQRFGMHHLVDFTMERWFTDPYRSSEPTAYTQIREQFLNTAIDGYIGCCHAIYDMNYLDQLNEIQLPTHIIVGDQDLATPITESEAMHKRIAGSTMALISGGAHLCNIECADSFNHSLMKFLDSQLG